MKTKRIIRTSPIYCQDCQRPLKKGTNGHKIGLCRTCRSKNVLRCDTCGKDLDKEQWSAHQYRLCPKCRKKIKKDAFEGATKLGLNWQITKKMIDDAKKEAISGLDQYHVKEIPFKVKIHKRMDISTPAWYSEKSQFSRGDRPRIMINEDYPVAIYRLLKEKGYSLSRQEVPHQLTWTILHEYAHIIFEWVYRDNISKLRKGDDDENFANELPNHILQGAPLTSQKIILDFNNKHPFKR
jgi:hypothetical protein